VVRINKRERTKGNEPEMFANSASRDELRDGGKAGVRVDDVLEEVDSLIKQADGDGPKLEVLLVARRTL
jgi:hypothetical protein